MSTVLNVIFWVAVACGIAYLILDALEASTIKFLKTQHITLTKLPWWALLSLWIKDSVHIRVGDDIHECTRYLGGRISIRGARVGQLGMSKTWEIR